MTEQTDRYVCTLDAASLAKAKKELNEDEKNRDGAVETLRAWVNQQKWLKSPTDYSFLLKFLRTKKFSQLEARKTLENFWKKRLQNSAWFCNKYITDPKVLEVLKTGFLLRLPNADKDGQIWLLDRPGALNVDRLVKELGVETVFKTYSLILDWLMMDERIQVNGLCWVVDMGGMSMKHNTSVFTPGNMKKFLEMVQGVYPARVKKILIYNTPPVLEVLVKTAIGLSSEKIKKRIKPFGNNLAPVYKEMDISVLPIEYLPDDHTGPSGGSIEHIKEYMLKELTSDTVKNHVHNLSNGLYGADTKLKPDNLPTESFRKLNVD